MSTNGTKTLAAALLAAQKKMPAVDKNAVNPHYRSAYTTLDHLLAKVLPVLNEHGLALIQQTTEVNGAPALKTTLLHESGESLEDVTPLVLGKADPQGYGAALTYFRRYAIGALLSISTEDDDDANSAQPAPAVSAEPTGGTSSGSDAPAPSGGSTSSKPALLPHQKKAYAVYKATEEKGATTKDATLGYMQTELGAMKWSELGPDGAAKLVAWLEARPADPDADLPF